MNTGTAAAPNENLIFQNVHHLLAACRINNTQIDDAQYIDVVMLVYHLIEYSENYSKTSDDGAITEITKANVSNSELNNCMLWEQQKEKLKKKIALKASSFPKGIYF